jgi:hypothetical protein
MQVRELIAGDWPAVWPILEAVVRAGSACT